jgi:hypothetical protein
VVQAFFAVLEPAQIDALDRVTARHQEPLRHSRQEVTRLEYAAQRAARRYDRVDPGNRVTAATPEANTKP